MYLSTESWLHTFEIPLPRYFKNQMPINCTKTKSECFLQNTLLQQIDIIKYQTISHVNNTLNFIHEIVPHTNLKASNRKTRSLLPFIGSLSKTLFNTATMDDVNILASHVNQLIRQSSKISHALYSQNNKISSFMTLTNNRITNLKNSILNNHKELNNLAHIVSESEIELKNLMLDITASLVKQINTASIIRQHFDKLHTAIESLLQGKISPFLISKQDMHHTIKQIQHVLNSKYTKYHITEKNPTYYYQNAKIIYMRHSSSLYLTVKFPISSYNHPMKLYEVISLPVPINATSSHATQLLDLPKYIMITDHLQHYTTLDSEALTTCNYAGNYHCKFSKSMSPFSNPSCILALFTNKKLQIQKLCNFRFISNILESKIIELTSTSLLIYNTYDLAMDCPTIQKVISGCKFCIMKVPCQCTISTQSLYFSSKLGNCQNASTDITQLHPVNLALLHEFLQDKSLDTIFGDTLFKKPIDVSLPSFQMYNHKFSEFLVNDKKDHLSMTKMVQATKNQSVIFQSLSEPLLDGQISLSQQWPDTNAILIFSTMATTGFTLLLSIFLFYKYKQLCAMFLMIKQAKAASLPHFEYTIPTSTAMPNFDFYDFIQELNLTHGILVINILTFIFILVILIQNCLKRKRKSAQLMLEITTGGKCLTLKIQELFLCPSYFIIKPPTTLRNCILSDFWECALFIDWPDFTITNKSTSSNMLVDSKVKLSYYEWYQLKYMLTEPYAAYIIVNHQGTSTPLNLDCEK